MLVGLPLVVYLAQDALIFYRAAAARSAPRARSRSASRRSKEVFLQGEDGTQAACLARPGEPGAPLVIYFGGNAEEVSWMLEETRQRARACRWLLVSYRGYGVSEGSPGEAALVSDALQWFDYAVKLPAPTRSACIVFGRSLGSGVAVRARRAAAARAA